MSRAPFLTEKITASLEALVADMPPAAYLGTDKELGVKYLTALVQHRRDPATITKRKQRSETTLRSRRKA